MAGRQTRRQTSQIRYSIICGATLHLQSDSDSSARAAAASARKPTQLNIQINPFQTKRVVASLEKCQKMSAEAALRLGQCTQRGKWTMEASQMHRISINRNEGNQLSAAKGDNAGESKSTGFDKANKKRGFHFAISHTFKSQITNYFCQSFKYFSFHHLSFVEGRRDLRCEIWERALIPFKVCPILNPLRSFCIANPFTSFRFALA